MESSVFRELGGPIFGACALRSDITTHEFSTGLESPDDSGDPPGHPAAAQGWANDDHHATATPHVDVGEESEDEGNKNGYH